MTRTLEQSLARAQNLRDFRFTSPKAFERSDDFRDIVNLFEEIERHRALQDRSDAAYQDAKLGKVVDDIIACLDAGNINGACDVFDAVIVNGFGDTMFESARPGELKKFWKDMRGMLIAIHAKSRLSEHADTAHAMASAIVEDDHHESW